MPPDRLPCPPTGICRCALQIERSERLLLQLACAKESEQKAEAASKVHALQQEVRKMPLSRIMRRREAHGTGAVHRGAIVFRGSRARSRTELGFPFTRVAREIPEMVLVSSVAGALSQDLAVASVAVLAATFVVFRVIFSKEI